MGRPGDVDVRVDTGIDDELRVAITGEAATAFRADLRI